MKFSLENASIKIGFGTEIIEYCDKSNPFPISCAMVRYRNGVYPWKINHNFHETFFVLEGECFIEFESHTVKLDKNDFFVLAPEQKYRTRAEFADVLVSCTPPFNDDNVEVCEGKSIDNSTHEAVS